MTRLLASLALSFALLVPAQALGVAETLPAGAGQAFQSLSGVRVKSPLKRYDAVNGIPAGKKAPKGSRYMRVRGFVTVSGTGHVPGGQSGYVFITVSGNTQLQDDAGRYLNGSVSLSDSSSYYVNGNHVSGFAHPSANVSIYRNGRYLGNVRVEGSIHVSGFNSNGWVRLSGSGWVDGSGYIQEEEPQAP